MITAKPPMLPEPTSTDDDVLRRAEARWQQVEAEWPDLAPAVALQRTLVRRITAVAEELDQRRWTPPFVEPSSILDCLSAGRPLLLAQPVEVPMEIVQPALLDLCQLLDAGGAGEPARHIHDALRDGRLDTRSVASASLARRQGDIRTGALQVGLAPDLLWLVAELSVGPIADAFQRATLGAPLLDADTRAALERRTQGTCPACGSWPALAEASDAHTRSRCSFCGAAWRLPSGSCPYCDAPESTRTAAPVARHPDWRILTCARCSGYLKLVPSRAIPFALLPVEDLATTALDVDAMEQGFVRPAMLETPADDDCAQGA